MDGILLQSSEKSTSLREGHKGADTFNV